MNSRETKTTWWASGDGIKRSGPYRTQAEAWRALRYTPKMEHITGRLHPMDAKVWPEEDGELGDSESAPGSR